MQVTTTEEPIEAAFTERTASKTEFGTRTEPVDGLYGYTTDGHPILPERGQLMRARTNANGQPADALLAPDAATDLATWHPGNASASFVDPTGEQIVGVASGLDDSTGRVTVRESSSAPSGDERHARSTSRFEHSHSGEDEPATSVNEVETAELEVLTPDGEYVRLGELLPEPEQFAGTSIESIERSLAAEAEIQQVTDDIVRAGSRSDEVELIGRASWIGDQYEALAQKRPSTEELAEARTRRRKQARRERIRPLLELDDDEHEQVCAMAHRLLSEEFEQVHEVRKTPRTLAIELAKRVTRGVDPDSALLRQAEAERSDPRHVQTIGNVRYLSTDRTRGRFSTQGRVTVLFENTHDGIKQAGVLTDDTGSIKFAIWVKSEWDETRPTPDPTDDGRTLIRSHRFPDLQVGDRVRCEDVVRSWYDGDPTFETRRDSTIAVLERAGSTGIDDNVGDDVVAPDQ